MNSNRISSRYSLNRFLGGFLYRFVIWGCRSLQKRSPQKWVLLRQNIGEFEPKNEALDIGRLKRDVYKANKEEGLKSLTGWASTGDITSQKKVMLELPIWAKEIQPFLSNQLSQHTQRAYESDLKNFFSFLEGRISPQELTELRSEHIILYRKALEEGRLGGKPLEKSTINRKLAVVKSFFNWLKLNHVVSENPAALVKSFPQSQESSLKGLSDAEAKRMLELPILSSRAGAMHSAVLHVLLYMGLRKAELIGLKVGDLGDERGVKVLKIRGKGHRVRILPLTERVRAAIEHYFVACRRNKEKTEEPLFMPTKNPHGTLEKKLNPHAITYIVVRYARKAGVMKKISPHSCRATCISNALDRKATQRSVQHLAGWSTPLMIQRYDKRKEDLQNSAAFIVDYGATATS